jgi:hypothetical protein
VRLRSVFVAVVVALSCASAACGGGGGGKKTTTTTASTTTTTPQPVANVEVSPADGNVGTTFKLVGTGFKPGENVTFEVDFPDNRTPFKGAPHKTTPDGAVQTTYRATAGNPAGTYTVKAIGDQGTTGEGKFQLGGAASPSTATPATASTTTR